jgi:hypothetical protein
VTKEPVVLTTVEVVKKVYAVVVLTANPFKFDVRESVETYPEAARPPTVDASCEFKLLFGFQGDPLDNKEPKFKVPVVTTKEETLDATNCCELILETPEKLLIYLADASPMTVEVTKVVYAFVVLIAKLCVATDKLQAVTRGAPFTKSDCVFIVHAIIEEASRVLLKIAFPLA